MGIPGYEDEVRIVVKEELQPVCDEISIDKIGNIIGTQHGHNGTPTLMFTAHMDVPGFMIRYIGENGFLRFARLGNPNLRAMEGEKVIIHTKNGKIVGVIQGGLLADRAAISQYYKEGEMKVLPLEQLYIDIGASSKEEAESWGVKVGDPVTYAFVFEKMKNPNILMAGGLDNRCGCAVMIETMKRLAESGHEATICGVGTVQEELGARGSGPAAFGVNPDVAIVLDMPFHAGDVPSINRPDFDTTRMGGGVMIQLLCYHPRTGFFVVNRRLFDLVEGIAMSNNIPVQPMVHDLSIGSTDARTINLVREGVPVMPIAVMGRYVHCARSMVNLRDVEHTIKLASEVAKSIQNFQPF